MVTEAQVWEALSTVIDPEVGYSIVDMGLIYEVTIGGGNVHIKMTLSTKGCPLHEMMKTWTKEAVEKLDGVERVEVEIVWEPAWNITMAKDHVKKAMGG